MITPVSKLCRTAVLNIHLGSRYVTTRGAKPASQPKGSLDSTLTCNTCDVTGSEEESPDQTRSPLLTTDFLFSIFIATYCDSFEKVKVTIQEVEQTHA